MSRECSCGSGLERRPLFDGYGIFLTYVCDECETTRTREFRSDIFSQYLHDEPLDDDQDSSEPEEEEDP